MGCCCLKIELMASDLLFVYVSLLRTVMLSLSIAPPDFVISGSIQIPKATRVSLSDLKNRSITISSLLSKILYHIIIDHQVHSIFTSDYQFGFKSHSSTVLCTTMVNETIQYSSSNGSKLIFYC